MKNIIDADYRLFYVHRGMEKLAETRMGYNEVAFPVGSRVVSAASPTAPPATTSVENAMGIQVPERAQMIRAILLEVERLHFRICSTWFGLSLHRFLTPALCSSSACVKPMKNGGDTDRGAQTYGLNIVAGFAAVQEDMIQTRQLAQQMRRDAGASADMLLSTPNMEQRTVGGRSSGPEIARDFSNVGPMVRASGHACDTRADHPFVGYGLLR